MVSSAAKTADAYIASLPKDRKDAVNAVRNLVNAYLPAGYEEGMQYGMIGWYIPLARYPDTYNKQPIGIAALASQKNYMALYLTSVYGDKTLEKWFKAAFAKAGKKLDMGKSCVRFKKLDDLPLDVIGETIGKVSVDDLIAKYEAVKGPEKKPKSARAVREKSAPAKKSKKSKRRK
jgi:hypothetical protein